MIGGQIPPNEYHVCYFICHPNSLMRILEFVVVMLQNVKTLQGFEGAVCFNPTSTKGK